MKFKSTRIENCYVAEGQGFPDERGSFARLIDFSSLDCVEWKDVVFGNLNLSETTKSGTFRGLHMQTEPFSEHKVVIVIEGAIHDVLVDLRPDSPSFGKIEEIDLEMGQRAILVPRGVAHGFQAVKDNTKVLYLVSAPHHPKSEYGVNILSFMDLVNLPLPIKLLSKKDNSWNSLQDVIKKRRAR
jgi:dTDP-4-dehydrorhamnose 3,5-epimerase